MTAFVTLGKNGDVLSSLPIIQKHANGSKANVVIAKEYAGVIDGLDFVEPHVFPGHWQDTAGAIKWAKERFPDVVSLATFGKGFPVRHHTPSFQLDQWHRAGCVKEWDALPLTLPRPINAKDIVEKYIGTSRAILLMDKSESSPFPYKAELTKALEQAFPTHVIVRLAEIKLPNIKDFLALYDAADCLVSIDTSHLHLSAATATPVVALVNDHPHIWRGSAWSKRFAFYCRYSDFLTRKDDLIRAVDNAINKREPVQVQIVDDVFPMSYNLGSILHNGKLLTTYRYHPEPRRWRTELALTYDGATHKLTIPDFYEFSWEDARLFYHKNKLFMSYTLSQYPTHVFRCVVGYGELEIRDGAWALTRHIQPIYSNNDFSGLQKNWLLFSHGEKLYAIYGSAPQQTVLELDGAKVVSEHKSPGPTWGYGEIRGGAIVKRGDRLLRFFHSMTGDKTKNYRMRYHIGCLEMEPVPPFKVIRVSKHPIFSGDERWVPNCPHWKPNVAIPYGVIEQGKEWHLSVGLNDSICAVLKVKEEHLGL